MKYVILSGEGTMGHYREVNSKNERSFKNLLKRENKEGRWAKGYNIKKIVKNDYYLSDIEKQGDNRVIYKGALIFKKR